MPDEDDVLLYVLSSLREMSWSKYKEVFGILYSKKRPTQNGLAAKVELVRFRTLRALASLGHCDFYFENGVGRVYSAPSLLVRLPVSGFPKALLCGARSSGTLTDLARVCKEHACECQIDGQVQDENTPFIPVRIVVESDDVSCIASVAKALAIRFVGDPPSWVLANYAPTLAEYYQELVWERDHSLDWQREDFDPHQVKFSDQLTEEVSVRLSRYKDPVRGTYRYYLFKNNQRAQIDVAWGRYAALQLIRQPLLLYDISRFTLAVPVAAPLPSVLTRSAVLCTGYVPRIASVTATMARGERTGIFEVYSGIPEQLAKKIAEKLGQHLVAAKLTILDEE